MDPNKIMNIIKVIESLPWVIEEPLMKAFMFILFCAERLARWPEKMRDWGANMSGHQFITVLKMFNADTTTVRAEVKDMLIDFFDLSDDWLPKWPIEQPT